MKALQAENLILKMEISRLENELASRGKKPKSSATTILPDATIIIPSQSTSIHQTAVSEDTVVIPSRQETVVLCKKPPHLSDRRSPSTTATASAEVVAEGSASM